MGGTRADTAASEHPALILNVWRGWIALALGLFAFSIPMRHEELHEFARASQRSDRPALWSIFESASSPDVYPTIVVGLEIAFVVALLVAGLTIALGNTRDWRNLFFSAVFITYSIWVTPTLDALGEVAALRHVVSMVQAVGLILAIHFFLMFPDGRFTPRWTRISSAFWIIYTIAWGVFPDAWFSLQDPFDVPWLVFAALMTGWVTGLVAQAARYRSNSTDQQRRQTRWVILAIAGAVVGYGAVYVPTLLIPDEGKARVTYDLFGVPTFWLLAMPMAFALVIAMLRHGLFDVHTAINRTLVYGSLTATLAGAYLVMVTTLGRVLQPIAGTSDLAIAASTLTVAGLFKPARGRIQHLIDSRFYRNRYDAAQALERFAACMRQEVELESLERQLIDLVHETMRPSTASLSLLGPTEAADADPERGAA